MKRASILYFPVCFLPPIIPPRTTPDTFVRFKNKVENPKSNIAVGSIQVFIDEYLSNHKGKVDYIHGEDVTKELGSKDNNIGIILEPMKKSDLFKTVIVDGALPRKTFSMGHSNDKRFYLEARKIK